MIRDEEDRDRELVSAVDVAMAGAAVRAGKHLLCRPGCTECCIGPFPINELDARRLRRGILALRRTDPEQARDLEERAAAARQRLQKGFPGDGERGVLDAGFVDDQALGDFLDRHTDLPCPVLDPATGLCQLYAWRPLACRTFGPPALIGGQELPPCHLCFRTANAATERACRVEPDAAGREDLLLAELEAASAASGRSFGETFIAFACHLRGDTDGQDRAQKRS